MKQRIVLAATGGTIASETGSIGRTTVSSGAAQLLDRFPEINALADVRPIDVFRLPSQAVTPEHMCQLAHAIDGEIEAGLDGVVITHGTDTLEETAYALALMLPRRVPIVLTGAMRSSDQPGADGPANLLGAVRLALSPEVGALGPVVAIQDEIHLARWVSKVHTTRIASFASPGFGPVGSIIEGSVRLEVTSNRPDFLGLPPRLDKRVELIWVTAGADGLLVDAAARKADGLVVAGTGAGHVPPGMLPSLESAARRHPVVLTSRTGSGPLLAHTYGGVGSETDLYERGLLPAGALSPIKSRLRLMVALALGLDPRDVFPV